MSSQNQSNAKPRVGIEPLKTSRPEGLGVTGYTEIASENTRRAAIAPARSKTDDVPDLPIHDIGLYDDDLRRVVEKLISVTKQTFCEKGYPWRQRDR